MKDIAVLMCTRKRLEPLKACIKAFLNTCASPDNFEILLAMDDDDKNTSTEVQKFLAQERIDNVRVFEFQRLGWARMWEYLNVLCTKIHPNTQWLMQWTDDQHATGKNWDRAIIQEFAGQFVLPWFEYDNDPWANSTFPYLSVVPIEWYKLFGVFLRHRQPDWFINEIVRGLDIFRKHPALRVHNLKLSDPETGKQQVYINSLSPEERLLRDEFHAKLVAYLQNRKT